MEVYTLTEEIHSDNGLSYCFNIYDNHENAIETMLNIVFAYESIGYKIEHLSMHCCKIYLSGMNSYHLFHILENKVFTEPLILEPKRLSKSL